MARILLAEDDNDMRRFLVKALERAGYDVSDFDNGASAYERLREEPFSLLLTDIVMPEMDGIELARRATEIDPDLKVMFITGFAAVALNPDSKAPRTQDPVQALPPARPRQRGREDAAGRLTLGALPRSPTQPRRPGCPVHEAAIPGVNAAIDAPTKVVYARHSDGRVAQRESTTLTS